MAISPLGSVIFTNQMTPAAVAIQNAYTNRVELQNLAAQAAVNEKDEKVLEVRPAEEIKEINEDKEHARDEADRETKRSPKHEEEEEEDEEVKAEPIHILDIKV